ncbi:hypothetical protein EJB05_44588, partial [Eragrostis curvula]
MAGGKSRIRKAKTLASSALHAPPADAAPAEVLPEYTLIFIFRRLTPAELLRAALACHRWRRAAVRALPLALPVLGYFFHPAGVPGKPPLSSIDKTFYPAVFAPLEASSPRLSLALSAGEMNSFKLSDVHLGLVILLPRNLPEAILPRVLVIDPASRRRALLPSPPRGALPNDRWRCDRQVFGVSVLSRAHPSRLSFDAVLFTVDGDRPRAWVASVRDGDCTWRAVPRSEDVQVKFDPWWFENRCVHAAGNIYWHICNSNRVLKLDSLTLDFSFIPVPAAIMDDRITSYRIGETPEDGRLCIVVMVDEELQIWVRGEARQSRQRDRGWLLETRMCVRKVLDTVPGLPSVGTKRHISTWFTDMDYARTGKVFVGTWGYGRYSFHMETGKLERLKMKDGKEWGHPIWGYTLAWPPAGIFPEEEHTQNFKSGVELPMPALGEGRRGGRPGPPDLRGPSP